MPSVLADLHSLADAVQPQSPSGVDLAYSASYAELERLARGRCEQQYGAAVFEAQEPHWATLQEHAIALAGQTHDLRVGVYLTQGLTRTQGLAGLADGLELLACWLTNEWDTLYPALDPDDGDEAVERSNILLELGDRERTLTGLLRAPLATAAVLGTCTLQDLRIARGERQAELSRGRLTLPEIQAIFIGADRTDLATTQADVKRAARNLDQIRQVFETQTGTSPNLEPVALMLQEILSGIDDFTREPTRESPPLSGNVTTVQDVAPPSASLQELQVGSRRDVVAILNALCDYYYRNEPSSPVPLFLQRARRLVNMDFVDIVRNLAPDGLADVSRWAGGLDACDKN